MIRATMIASPTTPPRTPRPIVVLLVPLECEEEEVALGAPDVEDGELELRQELSLEVPDVRISDAPPDLP